MEFEKFKPKPHPTKKFFNAYNFPISAVSKHLDLSFQYVSSILSGASRCTADNVAKLWELVGKLEKEWK